MNRSSFVLLPVVLVLPGCLSTAKERTVRQDPLPAAVTTSVGPLAHRRRLAIDLGSALELAGERSPAVRLARLEELSASATTLARWYDLLPTVSPIFRFFDHVGRGQSQTGTIFDVHRQNYEAQVVLFNAWSPGPVAFDIAAADHREDEARALTAVAGLDVSLDAGRGYLDLVRSRALETVAREALDQARELARVERSREKAGADTRAQVLMAEAELAAREQDLSLARAEVASASARLVEILALEKDVELVPADEVPRVLRVVAFDHDVAAGVDRALELRPELHAAEAEVLARERERDAVVWGPVAPFVVGFLQTGGFGATLGSLGFSQDAFVMVGWRFGIGGIFDVPRMQIANLDVQASHLAIDRARASIQLEVVSARAAVVTAEQRLTAAREGLRASRELLRLAKDRLEKGVAIELEVLDAQHTFTRSRAREIDAIADLDVARLALLRAVGVPSRAR